MFEMLLLIMACLVLVSNKGHCHAIVERHPESSILKEHWTPAFAGVTKHVVFLSYVIQDLPSLQGNPVVGHLCVALILNTYNI